MKKCFFLLLLLSQLLISCSNSDKKPIFLNSNIENGLLEFWESNANKKKRGNLPLCLSLYEYEKINRVGITFSQIYSDNEIKGLFYLDSIPILLLIEENNFDKKIQDKVFKNADFKKLKKNQMKFIERNIENVSDSFDPPYILYEIHANGLERVH